MKIACTIKISENSYLSENFNRVPRSEAFVGSEEECIRLAIRSFGQDWGNHAQIEELSIQEWLSAIGRRGGQVTSDRKLRHLHRLGKQRSARARRNRRRREQRKAAVKRAAARLRASQPR